MRSLFALVWLLASLSWLSHDRLVRDGDEEGHVGAAELLRLHLDGGEWLTFAQTTWRGDLGEYPPLYPAWVAAWWWLTGSGQPGEVPVRAVNLVGLLLAAWATSRLAEHLQTGRGTAPHARLRPAAIAGATAFALVLTLPLANGLARHFMPEGLLVGWVALTIWTTVWATDRRDIPSAVALGLVLGAGMLIKQTYLPLVGLPVAVAGARLRATWLPITVVAGLVAGPWYLGHWADQTRYVTQSVQGAEASVFDHLVYYPAVGLHLVAGPILVLAGLVGVGVIVHARSKGPRRGLAIALAWLFGAALLLAIPKKYPRLAAPIAPALALLAGLGAAQVRRREVLPVVSVAAATGWLTWTSLAPPDLPAWVPVLDEKCPQHWLRPPQPDDMGLSAIVAALEAAPPGPLAVAGAPEIPCSVQTTHPWASHLEPYLRRAGIEREVQLGTHRSAAVQVTFVPLDTAEPEDLPSPALALALRIEVRR